MCVYINILLYVCKFTHTHTPTPNMYIVVYKSTYIHTHIYMLTSTHIVDTRTYTCMWVCACVHGSALKQQQHVYVLTYTEDALL